MQLDKYERRAKHNISKSTLRSRMSAMRNFEEFIGGGEPDADDFEEWVDHMIEQYENGEMKASTIREYCKAVKYYFQVVHGDAEDIEHVFNWLPSNDSDPGDFLTEEEWDEFLDNIPGVRYNAIFTTMYHYARRPTEIILLNRGDVKLSDEVEEDEEPTITFNILKKPDPVGEELPRMTVGGETYKRFRATFQLEPEVESAIKSYLPYRAKITQTIEIDGEEVEVEPLFTTSQGRISYSSVWREAKEGMKRAGIEKNVTPKTMRHTRATHLDWYGNSPGNIARDMLVHDPDSQVIGRYVHDRDEDDVREVMSMKKGGEEDGE